MRVPALSLATAALGVLAGLTFGFLLFDEDSPASASQPTTVAVSPVPAGAEPPPGTAGDIAPRVLRRVVTAPGGQARRAAVPALPDVENAPESCKRWVEDSVNLRTTVAELQERLDEVERQRVEQQGQRVEPPEDLGDAYRQNELLKRFTEAFEQAGARGEVTAIDCSEYPCVVYGEIDDHEKMKALLAAGAMVPYQDATRDVSVWRTRGRDEGGEFDRTHFGVGLFPKEDDEARGAEIGKRLDHRKRQMWDTIRPR